MRKMLMAMAKDIRVILIKIADRLHNMRTMEYQSERKQKQKSLETMEIYAPIAYRLGMQKIKWELEDLALIYLDPIGYKEIKDGLERTGTENAEFIDRVQKQIKERLDEAGINATVYGRVKHLYSIYRKMYGQNKLFSEVMDLFAFRVVVDDIAECYNVLGHIHDMFKPIPGYFKDYIGTPKPNMYQSLHTSVIGKLGVPFEVQIRTWEMHQTAEYGIAAHWKYKEGIKGKNADEEKFAWVRRLLESQQDLDAQDFISSLKFDMFSDEVFVFTPRGDVMNLPAGATPIDFAYSIHSAIGNSMSGAIVNGRIVPFNHVLQNGDIVEVLTNKGSKGPSRDWMKIVVSSEARNKIRQWFKKEKREENIVYGKQSFDAEMKRAGVPFVRVCREDTLPRVLKRVAFASLDDLYATIGYGGISAQKVVNKIADELRQIDRQNAKKEETLGIFNDNKPTGKQKPVHGIVVEGLDNCLVKFSKCCTPVAGDNVVGFITRGYGVSVHRTDCVNYINAAGSAEDAGRWVNVSWAGTEGERYQTTLKLVCRNRDGLIMDIATVLNYIKVKVTSLSTRENGSDQEFVFISLEVADRNELAAAMTRLSGISGILDVQRAGSVNAQN